MLILFSDNHNKASEINVLIWILQRTTTYAPYRRNDDGQGGVQWGVVQFCPKYF